MSELGLAVYDPRKHAAAGSPPYTIEERLQKIHVRHYIASPRRKVTPSTCNALMHTAWADKSRKVVDHFAHPYECTFARSRIRTSLQIRDKLQDVLNRLPTRCLTPEEVARDKRRSVVILFWDAKVETKIMSQWGIQQPKYPPDAAHLFDPDYCWETSAKMEWWDLQKWKTLQQAKRNAKKSDSAKNMMTPLGVLECGHNGGNDAFAIVATFLYLLHSEEKSWMEYMTDFTRFPEEDMVKLDWIDPEVLEYNERLDPN